jgi:hypothetical protein
MKQYYLLIPVSVIENDSGTYKVWCEKLFGLDYYKFFAKQVSVKINGNHYFINNNLETFRFNSFTPNISSYEAPIKQYEIRLNYLRGRYKGKITGVEKQFEAFKQEVINKAHNDIREIG